MKRKIVLPIFVGLCLLLLSGCTAGQQSEEQAVASPKPTQQASHTITIDGQKLAEMNTPTVEPEPTSTPAPSPIVAPTKEQVLAAREQALEGMTEDQIALLCEVVDNANYWWESRYLYGNIFDALEDPEDLFWNCFNETGRVQIGWNCVGLDWKKICEDENLTWNEFCKKYSDNAAITESWIDNEYDADDFIDAATTIMGYVQNNDLRTDIQFLIDEMVSCRDNHDVQAANNLFKMFHDMHYYLLNYSDSNLYADETSIVSKYFRMLSVFK